MRNDYMVALVWLGFFAAVFLAWYFYLKARNKERMALIESGKDVSEIYTKQEIRIRFPWLIIGFIVSGIGFGLGVVIWSVVFVPAIKEIMDEAAEFILAASMMFFGGLGAILGFYLDKRKN